MQITRRWFLGALAATPVIGSAVAVAAMPMPAVVKQKFGRLSDIPLADHNVVSYHTLLRLADKNIAKRPKQRWNANVSFARSQEMVRILRQLRIDTGKSITLVVYMDETARGCTFGVTKFNPAMPVSIMYMVDRAVIVEVDGSTKWVKDRTGQKMPIARGETCDQTRII